MDKTSLLWKAVEKKTDESALEFVGAQNLAKVLLRIVRLFAQSDHISTFRRPLQNAEVKLCTVDL